MIASVKLINIAIIANHLTQFPSSLSLFLAFS